MTLYNSQNNYISVQYSYIELGRDDNWLQEQIRYYNNDMAKN